MGTPTSLVTAVRIVDVGDGAWAVKWREGGRRKQRTGLSETQAEEFKGTLEGGGGTGDLPANIDWVGGDRPYRVRLSKGGRRVYKLFATLEAAVAYRDRAKAAFEAGESLPAIDAVVAPAAVEAPAVYVVESVERWWVHRSREQIEHGKMQPESFGMNETRIEDHIVPFFAGMRLDEITAVDIRRFRAKLAGMPCDAQGHRDRGRAADLDNWESGYAPKTAGPIVWIVWAALDHARESGWIKGNPAAGLTKALKPRKPIGKGHKFVWMDLQNSFTLSRHLHAAFSAHFWVRRLCGLRNGEAAGLRIRDVDLDLGVLHVSEQAGQVFLVWDESGAVREVRRVGRTKTPAGARTVGIPPLLIDMLRWYIEEFRSAAGPNDPLMIGPQGGTSNDSLRIAMKPAANELRFGEAEGNPPSNHDLRGSFSLDLFNLPGVDHVDRSILMGHAIQGSIEGGSAVTMGSYTRRHPTIERAVSIAEKLDKYFRETTGVTSLIPTGWDELSQRTWISLLEAAAQFGMDELAVRLWAQHGLLESTQRRSPFAQRRGLMVSQESVDALLADRAARVTQGQVCEEFGIAHRLFTQIATEYDIRVYTSADDPTAAITGLPGGSTARAWLDPEGYDRFREVMGLREEWTAQHVPLSVAKVKLGVSPQGLLSLIERGIVTEVPAPSGLYVGRGPEAQKPTRWVTVESIDRALEVEATWRRQRASTYIAPTRSRGYRGASAHLSPAEAALRLKVSTDTVRNLINRGTLPTEEVQLGQRRRAMIPEAALEAYQRSIAGGKTDGRATRWQKEKPA